MNYDELPTRDRVMMMASLWRPWATTALVAVWWLTLPAWLAVLLTGFTVYWHEREALWRSYQRLAAAWKRHLMRMYRTGQADGARSATAAHHRDMQADLQDFLVTRAGDPEVSATQRFCDSRERKQAARQRRLDDANG